MITRCPSCTAEVSEEAARCPSCHWDFAALKKILPGETGPVIPPPKAEIVLEASPPVLPPPAPRQHLVEKVELKIPQLPALKLPPMAPEPAEVAPKPTPSPKSVPEPALAAPGAQSYPAVPPPPRKRLAGLWVMAAGMAVLGIVASFFFHSEEASRDAGAAAELFQKEPAPAAPPIIVPAKPPPPPPAEKAPAVPPAAAADAVPVLADKEPEPRATPLWVFEGRVYNLVNLEAVYGASLAFSDMDGKKVGEASTGDDGRYRVVLAVLPGGYRLSPFHQDFKERYLDEISSPWRKETKAERMKASRAAAGQNQPWIGSASETTHRDFIMIPKLAAEQP